MKSLVMGNHSKIISECRKAYAEMGYEESAKRTEMIDVLCVVSCYDFGQKEQDIPPYEAIEAIMEKMKERKSGKCILVMNGLDDNIMLRDRAGIYREQAGLKKWWKAMAMVLAEYNIQVNILNVGYFSYLDDENSKEKERLRKYAVIKRNYTYEDLYYGLKYMSSEKNSYLIGQELKLSGGSNIHPLKPVQNNALSEVLPKDTIKGSTVLIIGASSGIGKSMAYLAAKEGANVVLFARRLHVLNEIKQELLKYNVHVQVKSVDVTDAEELERSITESYKSCNGIDSMVYTSGSFDGENMLKSFEKWNQIWKTNMEGFAKAVATYVNCCKQNKKRGNIAGVASIGGVRALLPNLEAYGMSKAAMIHFTKAVALNYSKYGIRINCIAPGWVDTPMASLLTEEYKQYWRDNLCLKRAGKPEDMSYTLRYLISDESSYLTGETICIDGGVTLGMMDDRSVN